MYRSEGGPSRDSLSLGALTWALDYLEASSLCCPRCQEIRSLDILGDKDHGKGYYNRTLL